MTEAKIGTPIIERSKPQAEHIHALAHQGILDMITEQNRLKQEVIPLVDYLRDIAGKPRGDSTGGKEDLNSHSEQFILKEGEEIRLSSLDELQTLLAEQGLSVEILGVQSIGNPNQKVEAVVQGVNKDNSKSGFERPTVSEGPHMILAPYAVDKTTGELHLFRTIQMRTGEAVIDTPRGFADSKSLEQGQQMYDVENSGSRVTANMSRVLGEEAGEALKIKRIRFLGAPRVNSAFVTSKSAIFGVEVDYDAFIKSKKVVSEAEFKRRRVQFEHEGIVGDVLDIPLSEYLNYKRDSEINKDMAADFGTDTVVMDFLAQKLTKTEKILSKLGEVRKGLKQKDPAAYARHMAEEAKVAHPDRIKTIQTKTDAHLKKINPRVKPENIAQETKPEANSTEVSSKPIVKKGLLDRFKFWERK
jgi:hypothetical protein